MYREPVVRLGVLLPQSSVDDIDLRLRYIDRSRWLEPPNYFHITVVALLIGIWVYQRPYLSLRRVSNRGHHAQTTMQVCAAKRDPVRQSVCAEASC